jgi:hypothetical protein
MNQTDLPFFEFLIQEFSGCGLIAESIDLTEPTGINVDSEKSTSFSFPVALDFNRMRVIRLARNYFRNICGYSTCDLDGGDTASRLTMRCVKDEENFLVYIILPPGKLIVNIIFFR